jgi:hypothetical protein
VSYSIFPDKLLYLILHADSYNGQASNAAIGDTPLIVGEWSLATSWATNNTFFQQYGDAQKLAYNTGAGWIFW